MRSEIELPMKVVRVVPDVDVRAIREGQGLTREQFAERYGLQVRAIQEWEQGRRKPEPAVRLYAGHQEPAGRGAAGSDRSVARSTGTIDSTALDSWGRAGEWPRNQSSAGGLLRETWRSTRS